MGMRAFGCLILFAAFGCVGWGVGLKTPGLRSTATCTPEHAAVVALTSVRCAGVLERLTGFVGLLSSLRHPGRSTTAGRTEFVFVLGSCCETPLLGVVVLHADVMLLLLSVILVAKHHVALSLQPGCAAVTAFACPQPHTNLECWF